MSEHELKEFSTADDFKVICTEACAKRNDKVVIGSEDVFILKQLIAINEIRTFKELNAVLQNAEKDNYIFFQSMPDYMQKMFIERRKRRLAYIGMMEAEEFLVEFTFDFLKDCIKRAEVNVNPQ